MDDKVAEVKKIRQYSSLFLIACARGLLPDCQQLLEAGALPDTKDRKGLSAAHFAAAHGKAELLAFLWSKGVELDSEDPSTQLRMHGGRTPLHLAAMGGHVTAASFLLEKGCWQDGFDEMDNSALHFAAWSGHVKVIELLLKAAAKMEVRNKRGVTPLGEAIIGGHLAAAKVLVAGGASREDRARGLSLLHLAAGVGQPVIAEWFLTMGANPSDDSNVERLTPLHCAAMSGNVETVRLLVDRGAQAGATSRDGSVAAYLVPHASPSLAAINAVLSRAGGPARDSATSGGTMPRSHPGAADHDSTPSPVQQFMAMSAHDQLRRARRWAESPDEPATLAALQSLPPEVQHHIDEAASVGRSLTIHKAVTAVHNDEAFQKDMQQIPLSKIVEDIKDNPSNYARYAANPVVGGVLTTVRAVHSVVKANGGSTVSLQQLAAGNPAACQARDLLVDRDLTAKYDAHLKAACAAAIADPANQQAPVTAAREAYDAARAASNLERQSPAVKQKTEPAVAHGKTAVPADAPNPEIRPAHPTQHQSAIRTSHEPQPMAGPRGAERDDELQLDDDSIDFSWKTLKAECKRLLIQAAVMITSAAFVAWLLHLGPFAKSPHLAERPQVADTPGRLDKRGTARTEL